MKRALYSLFRKGDANLVKILCLGAGLALGLIMLAEVIFERSYDNFIPRLEDTYRIQESYKQKESDWRMHATVPGAIAPGMKSYCPEVEVATRYTILSRAMKLVTEDQREITGNAYLCDSSFSMSSRENFCWVKIRIPDWKRPVMPIFLKSSCRYWEKMSWGRNCHGRSIHRFK